MKCKVCGKEIKQLQGKNRTRCSGCNTKIRRYRAKLAAIAYLGGKCERCGWEGPVAGYTFHHKDPTQKEFNISMVANKSWLVIKEELDKCELLCQNCHHIEHSNVYDRFLEEVEKYNGNILDW
ncbi:MAG: hypothetical protein WDA59_05520 [Methanofastidiosum sp.]|jgi:predicted RNA-binding Zn-ribbon protein involved in translation (DUF1610 family)